MSYQLYSWTQRDALNAIPAIIRAQAGFGWPDDPCAQDFLRMGKPLLDVMKHATGTDRLEPAHQFVARAMAGMQDLVQSMTTGFDGIVQPIVATMRSHHAALADVVVSNFNPARVALGGTGELEEVPEHAEYPVNLTGVADALEPAGVKTYGSIFGASREALIGSDFAPVLANVADAAQAAMRNEKILFAAQLENTANTVDGSPIFHADHGNLLSGSSGGSPSATTYDAMFKAMANIQNAAGVAAGVLPRYVIVPPALAATAFVTTQAIFGDVLRPVRVDVIVNEFLTSDTTWYAVGDPLLAPAFGMVRLGQGSDRRTWRIESIKAPLNRDGMYWRLSQDVRVIRMSRYAVKVTS